MPQHTSLNDVIKENTSRVFKEMELQSPAHFQMYSDMYNEYLHMLDNMFGMLVRSEKKFIDKTGISSSMASEIGYMAGKMTDAFLIYLDNYGDCLHLYAKTRSEMMRSCDRYIHRAIDVFEQAVTSNAKRMNAGSPTQAA